MSQGQQVNLNLSNQSTRLNQQREDPTILERLSNINIIKLSRKNIIKGIFLLIIVSATFWMASDFLHQTLIRQRTPFKFGQTLPNIQQIAAPNDTALKSFYYFKKMVELAKKNVKNGDTYEVGQFGDQQFENINFWELYGLFKVVKAIQLANQYEEIDTKDDKDDNKDEQNNDSKYDSVDNLTAAVNLTSFFNKASDQAQCASCYSFPIAATIQYQIIKKTGNKVKLSEQQLIDCSNPDENANGCHDGNMTRGFEYARDTGLVQQKSYPYRSQTGSSYQCNTKILEETNAIKYKIDKLRSLPSGDCQAIQYQLVTGNAVASMINVGRMNLIKNYSQPFRDCLKIAPNHAVTIVGQTENQDWIVRNSWGQSWGNNGYFIIKKGNTCGICNHAIVPEIGDLKKQNQSL